MIRVSPQELGCSLHHNTRTSFHRWPTQRHHGVTKNTDATMKSPLLQLILDPPPASNLQYLMFPGNLVAPNQPLSCMGNKYCLLDGFLKSYFWFVTVLILLQPFFEIWSHIFRQDHHRCRTVGRLPRSPSHKENIFEPDTIRENRNRQLNDQL